MTDSFCNILSRSSPHERRLASVFIHAQPRLGVQVQVGLYIGPLEAGQFASGHAVFRPGAPSWLKISSRVAFILWAHSCSVGSATSAAERNDAVGPRSVTDSRRDSISARELRPSRWEVTSWTV